MPDVDTKRIRQSFNKHRASPEVSADAYLQQLTSAVGRRVDQRKKLYLDTRYWVFLRDAVLGRAKRPEHNEILDRLRTLVRDGLAICPVSDVAFLELTAQSDDVTRTATAALWDELSLGITPLAEPDRVRCELENFFRNPESDAARIALTEKVWTKAGYVLGQFLPTSDALPNADLLVIQKATIDACWETSFTALTADSSAHLSSSQSFDKTAQKLNSEMRQFQHEIPSFERAFLAECHGALDVYKESLRRVLITLYDESRNPLEEVDQSQFDKLCDQLVGMLLNGFRYRRDRMATRLPSLYVHAACHAAIRMDVNRKFNGNFLRDLHHGVVGAAYHDAMFTERPLQVLLTSGNVAVEKMLGSKILSQEREVLDYLSALA